MEDVVDGALKPFLTLELPAAVLSAITEWQPVGHMAYELAVEGLLPDEPPPGSGGILVKFGRGGNKPDSTTDQWDVKLRAGQQVIVAGGIDGFWWKPDEAAVGLRLVLTLVRGARYVPHVPTRDASASVESISSAVPMDSTDPASDTDGLAVNADASRLVIHLTDNTGARLYASFTADVWWQMLRADGVLNWVHNPADDFDGTGGLGDAGASHDAEAFVVPVGVKRVCVVRRAGMAVANVLVHLHQETARG